VNKRRRDTKRAKARAHTQGSVGANGKTPKAHLPGAKPRSPKRGGGWKRRDLRRREQERLAESLPAGGVDLILEHNTMIGGGLKARGVTIGGTGVNRIINAPVGIDAEDSDISANFDIS